MDREAEGHYLSRALRCHACAAKERQAKKFENAESRSLYFTVEEQD